ncbi:hypothetical protein C8A03DRAFT_37952 [Achaetomium macrosporum]|uniref:PD-(D/E)XK nuclease-like domain-containing protein n=1 Tax=Achaetomium macrosporum TaxID=79813 RepID=A0AAN7C3F5_9PEZI|nr:hypothetical protein C8A03DRAFT_37952 [Achaetomium macrosporum]
MPDARILDWLRSIDADIDVPDRAIVRSHQDSQQAQPSLKRKVRGDLPSPSLSSSELLSHARSPAIAMGTPSPRGKSRRTATGDGTPAESPTPRPPQRYAELDAASQDSFSAASSSNAVSSSAASSTKRSHTSPIKQLGRLEVAEFDPVQLRQMDVRDDDMPRALAAVIGDIGVFADGEGVIDQSLKPPNAGLVSRETVLSAHESARGLKRIREKCFLSSETLSQLVHPEFVLQSRQHSPTLADAVDIFNAAKACRVDRHAETDWNMFVHSRLVSFASANPWAEPMDPTTPVSTKFTPCTAARISPAYRPRTGSSKMVDFALFFEPSAEHDAAAREVIDDLRRALPGESIYHTDYAPLRYRPLALSVESKTTGHQLSEAEVQLGVWHAAQWRMLELSASRLRLRQLREDHDVDLQRPPIPASGDTAPLPPFLPAVIVQGHDWHFVATTR